MKKLNRKKTNRDVFDDTPNLKDSNSLTLISLLHYTRPQQQQQIN